MSEAQPWLDDPQASRDTPWLADAPAHYGAPREPQRPAKTAWNDTYGAVMHARDWLTMGGEPTLQGAWAAGKAGLEGKPMAPAFLDAKRQTEATLADYQHRRPLLTAGAQAAGAVAPMLLTGGESAALTPTQIAARGASTGVIDAARVSQSYRPAGGLFGSGFMARRVRDAGTGAMFGGAVGANRAAGEDWMTQAERIGGGLLGGGILGPAGGMVGEGAARAMQGVANAVTRLKLDPSKLGAGFGAVTSMPPPPRPPQINSEILKVASRTTPGAIAERARDFRTAGMEPLWAQALGEGGLRRAETLTNLAGETPELAANVIAARRQAAPGMLQEGVDKAFGTTSKTQLGDRLAAAKKAMGDEYDAILRDQNASPADKAALEAILAPIRNTPGDKRIVYGELNDKLSRRQVKALSDGDTYHTLRQGLNTRISQLEKEEKYIGDLVAIKDRLTAQMEKSFPGYKAVNDRWADTSAAQKILGGPGQRAFAKDALSNTALRPEEMKAKFDEMSPLQQDAAIVSIADDIRAEIRKRTKQGVRKTNVAERFLNEDTGQRLEAILGDKADDLAHLLTMVDRDFNELGSLIPRTGSRTAATFGDMVDMATAEPPTKHGMTKMADRAIGGAWEHYVRGPIMEGRRNKQGATLFSEFDQKSQDELLRALAAYNANARFNARASRPAAGGLAQIGARQVGR